MQAAPIRTTAVPSPSATLNRKRPARTPLARPSVTAALRAVEALLLKGGQRTARRNAWACVLEDRRRAKDRVEAQRVLDLLGTGTPLDGTAATGGPGDPATGTAEVTARTS
jgi:hypothetical protein